jgi:cytochrome c oxidase subunit 2
MRGTVYVMGPAEYAEWAAADDPQTVADRAGNGQVTDDARLPAHVAGKRAFEKYRCGSCHKHEGGGAGPSLVGLFGKNVPLVGGGRALADENYIRESILEPNAKVVTGYKSGMSTFLGQIDETEILEIIAYLESLEKVPQRTASLNAMPPR